MKRNKSSKTAFDLMRHYELKKFLEGIVTYLFIPVAYSSPSHNVFHS